MLSIDAKATEHIFHRQGIGRLKTRGFSVFVDARCGQAQEVEGTQSQKFDETVADFGTKPLSKAIIAKHSFTLGCSNMAEERC